MVVWISYESAKWRALVPYVPSCPRALRALRALPTLMKNLYIDTYI